MRVLVALLSSQQSISGDFPGEISIPCSAVRIGGRTVLSRQVDFALSAGCERIICLTQGLTPELLEAQHVAEKAGAVFHSMRTAINLSGLVSMADDVLVIADGLVFDAAAGAACIGPHRTVLTLPADNAVSLGFERVDQDRAWAGLMVIAGALVEKLVELPDDVDPQSSLLRLALQNGTRCAALPAKIVAQQHWAIIRSADAARAYEHQWLAEHGRVAPLAAPVNLFADRAALMTVRKHPKAGLAALSGYLISMLSAGAGALSAFFGYITLGLGLVFIAAFSARFAGSLAHALRQKTRGAQAVSGIIRAVIIDITIIFLCAAAVPEADQIGAGFAALMLIGLLHMVQFTAGGDRWQMVQAAADDRAVLVACLFAASLSGLLLPILQAITLLFLMLLMLQKYDARLTPA
ncbi:hypothetical protein [Pontixanthobacter sp.]|uniref:hypothetical protein n=1 Tax=Pontixanthobacter sp. TaxID=2792078 RepID=UPI003C7D4FE0